MTIEIPDSQIPAIVAEFAKNPDVVAAVKEELRRIGAELKAEDDLLTPEQAASILGVTTRTLSDNHKEWGLNKSLRFGATNPRYFRSEINAQARTRMIKCKQAEVKGWFYANSEPIAKGERSAA